MAKRKYDRVSQRGYADYLGISNTHVANAVKDGLIKRGWDPKEEKIIVQLADQEWGNGVRKKPAKIKVDDIWGDSQKKKKVELNESTDLGEARRLKEVFGAQLAYIELQEKRGELVEKKKLEKQLYEYGQQVRKNIEAVPERIIDSVRAAKDRNEALQVLKDAMREALESLTNGIV